MADERTAQPSVQAEEGHEVHGGQGHAGQVVDIRAVGRIEVEGDHRVGEEVGVGLAGPAVAVLVGLDLHDRRLGSPAEARQGPGVGVGLLALVGGAVDGELTELVEGALRLQEAGERGPVGGVEELTESGRHRGGGDRGKEPDIGPQGRFVPAFEVGGQPDEVRVPLPTVVDPGEAAVVELVDRVEGDVTVVAGERVIIGAGDRAERAGLAGQATEEGLGQRPSGGRRRRRAVEHEAYLPR